MSLNHIVDPPSGPALDVRFDNVAVNGNLVLAGEIITDDGFGASGEVLKSDGLGSVQWRPDDIGEVVFKPGIAESSGVLKATWAEVVEYVDRYDGACYVYLDDSLSSPIIIDSDIDCRGRTEFYPGSFSAGAAPQALVAGGTRIKNPRAFRGPQALRCQSIGVPSLDLSNGQLLEIVEGAAFISDSLSDTPCISIADGEAAVISVSYGGGMGKEGATPVINLGVGSTMIFTQIIMANPTGLQNDIISSTDGSSTIIMGTDASGIPITNAGYTGSIIPLSIDKAAGVTYDDSKAAPPLGADTVQGAIDALKALVVSGAGSEQKQAAPPPIWSFGGKVSQPPGYLLAGGSAGSPALAASRVGTKYVATHGSLLRSFSHDTLSADATTEYAIVVDGVPSKPFKASGPSGVVDGLRVPLKKNARLELVCVSGTPPGDGVYVLA